MKLSLVSVAALLMCCLLAAPVANAAEDKKPLTEEQKIDRLIATVETLKDAKFVRNGSEYDCKAAAEHVRRKRKAAGNKIKSAREFITQIASKSMRSGEPYKIKFKDGKEITSGEFLTKELEKLEGKEAKDE